MLYPVRFRTIPQERIWGGDRLKSWFGIAGDHLIGEYWVLSGLPQGSTVVDNGALAGKTLAELIKEYPDAFLGNAPQERFPLLIKFLEAREDLSVQIHPDDSYARAHEGDYGKTEAWYVLDCLSNGRVVFGHRFKDREEYRQAIQEKRVKDYLLYKTIQKDQVVLVPSRTLHALLAGTTVIEIQQASDVTYRVYDWDRVAADGKPRELHVDKADQLLTYRRDNLPLIAHDKPLILRQDELVIHEQLVECPYFTLERVYLKEGAINLTLAKEGNPDVLVVANGIGLLIDDQGHRLELHRGDTILMPALARGYQLQTSASLTLLRVYY